MPLQFDAMNVVAFAGGVGGAKLVDGLAQLIPPKQLTVIVNTGDDFEHLGLFICPDLDTVCYTLAGIANPGTGWGRADETWNALNSLRKIGGPDWFRLGDKDLGTHLERTRRLNNGHSLTTITREFCESWGVEVTVLPMSDDPIPTIVITDDGEISFQEYFVQQACQPIIRGFRYGNQEAIYPAPGVLEAIESSDLVVICPSNPWVSINPILSLPGILESLVGHPVVAVSPIIAGRALRGPAAKMYIELGITPSPFSVAEHYLEFLNLIIIDHQDREFEQGISKLGVQVCITDTIMRKRTERRNLAEVLLTSSSRVINKKMT